MRSSIRLLLAAALPALTAAGDASAQRARPTGAPADLPLAQFIGRRTESTKWPTANVRVDRDAYVTVLAITPGVNRFAVQVLSPASPQDDGFVRPRHPQRLGYFSPDAVGHRVARASVSQSPIIVGISSRDKPDLSAFARGKAWASDLVINVPLDSTTDLVDVVAQVIFKGDSVQFGVAPMPAYLPGVAGARLPSQASTTPPPEAPPSRYLDNGGNCYSENKSARGVCMNFDDRPGAMRWLVRPDDTAPRVVPTPVAPPAPPKPPAP